MLIKFLVAIVNVSFEEEESLVFVVENNSLCNSGLNKKSELPRKTKRIREKLSQLINKQDCCQINFGSHYVSVSLKNLLSEKRNNNLVNKFWTYLCDFSM